MTKIDLSELFPGRGEVLAELASSSSIVEVAIDGNTLEMDADWLATALERIRRAQRPV